MERSLHDALCAVKRTMESASVVPGGGSVESALSIYLENFATTIGSREQLAIAEFADSMLVIPKQLAVNAAQDATDIVAKLRSNHNAAQSAANTDADLKRSGLDCVSGATLYLPYISPIPPLHLPTSRLRLRQDPEQP